MQCFVLGGIARAVVWGNGHDRVTKRATKRLSSSREQTQCEMSKMSHPQICTTIFSVFSRLTLGLHYDLDYRLVKVTELPIIAQNLFRLSCYILRRYRHERILLRDALVTSHDVTPCV